MDQYPSSSSRLEYNPSETLQYFETAIDDGRIDRLIATGEGVTTFSFEGRSSFALDTALFPLNDLSDDGKQSTHYYASGRLNTGDEADFTLNLTAFVNSSRRTLSFQATETGDFFMYDNEDLTIANAISLKNFGNMTLLAANADPNQIKKSKERIAKKSVIFENNHTVFDYWVYMTQSRAGQSETIGTYFSEPIQIADNQIAEMRLTQIKKDLPHTQIETITLEHATQLTDLDAEIVYRLELYFESTAIDENESIAEKRIVSGCDRSLVRSRLVSQDKAGKITPLDINDTKIMDNFRVALEAMLQAVS